ncbi:MAG TPA: S1 RNA-binding domain-containing protein [Acidimicrobiales bacterium]|nr:S1 RNA-binding domain-containing protein [Acidimicrobiales bacterium]
MSVKHVIVDGSNIATEGRDTPSLAQLDEAVTAFIEEYSPKYVTVVVDATFPNRIDRKERKKYEDAVNANELVTPPAGAIGRGDAFILQIARRADASILSNDSFQEFHGEYPWLFDKGRLIGGKPVPHVGWVFMDRAPVRGPTSRRAVSEARKVAKVAGKAADKAVAAAEQATAAGRAAAEVAAAATGEPPAKASPKRRTRKAAAATAAPPEAAAVDEAPAKAPARRRTRKAAAAPPTEVPATPDGAEPPAAAAPDGDEVPAAEPSGDAGRAKGVEPYNEALPFIEFVGRHPVGSEVDAVVERFSSHGAYVLVGAARAYLPLRNLAHPAPRSAKEMLRVGEERRFVVVAIDPPRRGIDLAVPGVVDVAAPAIAPAAPDAPAAGDALPDNAVGKKAAGRKATAGKAAATEGAEAAEAAPPAKRVAARKAPAKAAAKRTAAKKAAAKQGSAKKGAAKQSAAGGAPAKKAAAGRAAAKQAPTKKAAAGEAPAKKAATKRATAGKAPTKKAAAKKAAAKKAAAGKAAANEVAATGPPPDDADTRVVTLPGETAGGRAVADPAPAEAASG